MASVDLKSLIDNFVEQAKDSLGMNPSNLVGIDIGLSSVKVAEISGTGKSTTLSAFAIEPLPEGALIEDEVQKPEEIQKALENALKKAKIINKNACLSLSGPNTVAKKLQLPGGTKEEIEDQVTWEAEQYLPFNIEESTVAFHIVGKNEGGGMDIIVAAARNDVINNFKNLVEPGMKTKVIDLGILAITNVFEMVMGKELEDTLDSWLIIDIGAQFTQFIIYKNKMVMFTKEMNIGGVMITEEIQRQMGVNYYEAEDLKINGDESGNLPEEILEIIDDVVESFFAEIKKTIDFYVSSTSDESLIGCYITGGGASIPGLIEGLSDLLGLEVTLLNPFDVIKCDTKKVKEDLDTIVYRGLTAIGCAMRTSNKKKK